MNISSQLGRSSVSVSEFWQSV